MLSTTHELWPPRRCYGKNSSRLFYRKLIANSGAIFASTEGFEEIAKALHDPCPNTEDSNFHGVDQVVLNWMVRAPVRVRLILCDRMLASHGA